MNEPRGKTFANNPYFLSAIAKNWVFSKNVFFPFATRKLIKADVTPGH